MKKAIHALFLFAAFAASFVVAEDARAVKAPKSESDSLSIVEKYEKLATEQEAIVKEHKEMRRHYRLDTARSLPKQTRDKSVAEMEDHCDKIIETAQALADEYKAVAQWHKVHAGEMPK